MILTTSYNIDMLKEFLIVGIGGFFGCGGRYIISKMISTCVASFPMSGTLVVNVLGCFAFGFIAGYAERHSLISPSIALLLLTGFCGGFTTFSTFANELFVLSNNKHLLMMIAYLVASLLLGVAMIIAGRFLALKF